MGLGASSYNLFMYTNRKFDLELQALNVADSKMRLTREMDKISREYQNALSAKTLKWSNNNGVSYVDLTYQNLMRPGAMNKNTPYILTDSLGMVVVDNEYKKFAEMISPNGAPGGNYESNRIKILSEITGIDSSKLEHAETYDIELKEKGEIIAEYKEEEPQYTKQRGIEGLLDKAGSFIYGNRASFDDASSWLDAYQHNKTITSPKGQVFTEFIGDLVNSLSGESGKLGKFFYEDKYKEKFTNVLTDIAYSYNDENIPDFAELKGSGANKTYSVNVKDFVDYIIGAYLGEGGDFDPDYKGDKAPQGILWYDLDSNEFNNWYNDHSIWQDEYNRLVGEYDEIYAAKQQLFTSDEEAKIAFYDQLFTAIADNGWTYNNQVKNTEYLNQMLQNNSYTITTMSTDTVFDAESEEYVDKTFYSSDIASNFNNIYTVSDSDVREQAMIEYETKKRNVEKKEVVLDNKSNQIQTEISAINKIIEGLQTVKKENIERTMNITG